MTDQQHPITPPPELVEQWFMDQRGLSEASRQDLATRAAQWGADQELEACCEWLKAKQWTDPEFAGELRAARRPKPPSLKPQPLPLAWMCTLADLICLSGREGVSVRVSPRLQLSLPLQLMVIDKGAGALGGAVGDVGLPWPEPGLVPGH